jgi:hypothetical protein
MTGPKRQASRRFVVGSPFNVPEGPEVPAEQYDVQDRVTHDKYGLGRVVTVEGEDALVIDFGSRLMRIKMPCTKLSKL